MAHNKQYKPVNTLGIVVDLHNEEGRNLTQETVRQTGDSELRNLLKMAQELGKRYLIAAGRFNGKGIFGTLCDDEESLAAAFDMANTRMNEAGSRTTAWLIKPETCAASLKKEGWR